MHGHHHHHHPIPNLPSFEGRGSGVQAIRSSEQSILHPQAQDGHHGQAPIGQFGVQAALASLCILHGLRSDAQNHVAVAKLASAVVVSCTKTKGSKEDQGG